MDLTKYEIQGKKHTAKELVLHYGRIERGETIV